MRAAGHVHAAAAELCAAAPRPLQFEAPRPWAKPIADYLAFGGENFPDGFNRAITALQPFGDRLWLGYGDGAANLGTRVPIEFRAFSSPRDPTVSAAIVAGAGQGGTQRTQSDTGEEQIEPFRVCGRLLCQAGVDSNDPDEAWSQAKGPERVIDGNFFRLEGEIWRKFRSIPGGEHVHDLATMGTAIYAAGSGAANRAEFERGEIYRYLWRSIDGGNTFTVVHRVMFPEPGKGDTRFRRLLVVGKTLYVFGFINPHVDKKPREGRHVRLVGERLEDLGGPLAPLVVLRTFELPDGRGLVVTVAEDRRTRTFVAREDGFTELASWVSRRVIDVAVAPEHGQVLVLCGDGGAPEHFSVQAAPLNALATLVDVVDLGTESASALALWRGALFIGTSAGEVWKAEPASPADSCRVDAECDECRQCSALTGEPCTCNGSTGICGPCG